MKRSILLIGILCLLVPFVFWGCSGDDGTTGAAGATGATGATGQTGADGTDLTAVPKPESCQICHNGINVRSGDAHQAHYDELYQDNVVRVTNLVYAFNAVDNSDVVTFNMFKGTANFNCTELDAFQDPPAGTGSSLAIYFVEYDNTATPDNVFNAPAPLTERLGIGNSKSRTVASTLTYNAGTNLCTSTKIRSASTSVVGDLSLLPGLVVVYGRNEALSAAEESQDLRFTRVVQPKYPFAALLETGAGVTYASAANVKGCEKCHTIPFLKHGYIYGQVNHDATNDFYTCKACHLDAGPGGHYEWQFVVDNPPRWAEIAGQVEATPNSDFAKFMTPAELTKYAYSTRLMNDVHMSHAMEFPYPQSMSNCVVCHEGKLGVLLTDANFVAETCKSCHVETGAPAGTKPTAFYEKKAPAMKTIWTDTGVAGFHNYSLTCNTGGCHVANSPSGAKSFIQLHTGYDKSIYFQTAPYPKYSAVFTVTIDNASFDNNLLTFGFSAKESPDLAGLAVADIKPTVLVGLYGYDTKDYYIGPHDRNVDDNGDGKFESPDNRNLEAKVNETHPRITTVSAGGGSWVFRANLSAWDNAIKSGKVKRVEIGVLPTLVNPAIDTSDNVVALNAPSRTYNLVTKAFENNYYSGTNAIVSVAKGCNNCHDALADTFHSPDRGGNIVVCRLCHITKDLGSHLEMQSRSIDSYAHSIHTFQAFDIDNVVFTDPVEALHYEEHIGFAFPTLGRENCRSCHNAGTFNVPDQSKSLPGALSAADSHAKLVANGFDRKIQDVKAYVTGPAARACGGCHRGNWINKDDAVGLASFFSHTSPPNGYLVEYVNDDTVTTVIDQIMPTFPDALAPSFEVLGP